MGTSEDWQFRALFPKDNRDAPSFEATAANFDAILLWHAALSKTQLPQRQLCQRKVADLPPCGWKVYPPLPHPVSLASAPTFYLRAGMARQASTRHTAGIWKQHDAHSSRWVTHAIIPDGEDIPKRRTQRKKVGHNTLAIRRRGPERRAICTKKGQPKSDLDVSNEKRLEMIRIIATRRGADADDCAQQLQDTPDINGEAEPASPKSVPSLGSPPKSRAPLGAGGKCRKRTHADVRPDANKLVTHRVAALAGNTR